MHPWTQIETNDLHSQSSKRDSHESLDFRIPVLKEINWLCYHKHIRCFGISTIETFVNNDCLSLLVHERYLNRYSRYVWLRNRRATRLQSHVIETL